MEILDLLNDCKLQILNKVNGAHEILLKNVAEKCQQHYDKEINFVIMGIAYGGEVEAVAKYMKLKKQKGKVYGFDTFEELHPKHLAKNKSSFEATCMDGWYRSPEYGTEKLSYEYQRHVLDKQGLDNAVLVKGEVHANSCKDIGNIALAFLDMDMEQSMRVGFEAVEKKIMSTGYLMLHDAIPKGHMKGLYEWTFDELTKHPDFVLDQVVRKSFTVVFMKK